MSDFDYEILHRCQYEIGGGDCGEPATYKVWWGEDETMLVCQEHFNFIKGKEAEEKTECMKCEELITEKEFEFNQGLCDKCYTRLRFVRELNSHRENTILP